LVALFRFSYVSPSDIIATGNARILKRGEEELHRPETRISHLQVPVRAECQSNDLHSIPS